MEFKERLQYLIDIKNISQRDVANSIGVNESKVSKWVSGKVKSPRRTTIQKLANFFGCYISWLATGEGDPFPKAEMARIGANITLDQLELYNIDDDEEAYEIPPSGDPLGIESMAKMEKEALAKHVAKQEQKSAEESFRHQANARLAIFIDWIKEEFGTDTIAIEQGFHALESGCEEFTTWKNSKLKARGKENNQTGTDN